jgi:hypothetical protein
MSDKKISALTSASTPLAGTEVLPIVQSGTTVKVASDDLTVKNLRANATTGILQVAGPAAASTRVMTTPDANFTVARTDAAQTFAGEQTFSNVITKVNQTAGTSGTPAYDVMTQYYVNANRWQLRGYNIAQNIDTRTWPAITATLDDGAQFEMMVWHPYDGVRIPNANLVIGTSGKGIDFSADGQAAGMTSELLDDYEEGTWTAQISDGTNNATMVDSTCVYTKVGRLVTVSGYVSISSLGSMAGSVVLSGLPFAVASAGDNRFVSGGVPAVAYGLNITANQVISGDFQPGTSSMQLRIWNQTTGTSSLTPAEWSNTGGIGFCFTYTA